jgi:hypothetical protein
VDGPEDLVAAQGGDDPLDVPPVTEAHDIAVVPAALGADRRLEPGIIPETLDQLGRIGNCRASVNEGTVHVCNLSPTPVSRLPTKTVNGLFTMLDLALGQRLGMGPEMPSTTRAGGCFLTLFILAGFPLGLAIGNPMKGILIGTGAGIVFALVTWLIDRTRR